MQKQPYRLSIGKTGPQPNRRLQLTAFGARDSSYFDTQRRASAAAEAQGVGPPLCNHLICC